MSAPGRVLFVGCGPGASDLLTLRAARAIATADIVVWGRSLLPAEAVEEHARPGAEIIAWPPATMREVLHAYDRARDEGLVVARLKSGDPSIFGEMDEELAAVRERGVAVEVVPGVSAVNAAAAVLSTELTREGDVLVCGARAPAGPPAAAVVLMPGRAPEAVASALEQRGMPGAASCAIVHRVSWPGELVARCRLDELTDALRDLALDGMTLVVARRPPEAPAIRT